MPAQGRYSETLALGESKVALWLNLDQQRALVAAASMLEEVPSSVATPGLVVQLGQPQVAPEAMPQQAQVDQL